MATTVLSDLVQMKTGDLIDAIHDVVCGLSSEADREIMQYEFDELFRLVDELRSRSLAQATSTKAHQTLDS